MKKNNRYNALNKERKKANLTFGMIRLLVICLVVPFGALSVVLFFSSASKTSNQVRNTGAVLAKAEILNLSNT